MNEKKNPAKEFLSRYGNLFQQRESLLRSIDIIRANATNTGIHLKDVRVQSSSPVHDQMAEDAAKIVDMTAKLDALVKEIDQALSEILMAIRAVEDSTQQTVLMLRYVEGLDWADIMERIGYEKTQTMVYHGRALLAVKAWLEVRTKTD
jgi:DNA-directed RNA polymerase specialized sigma24 family protein